MMLLTHNSFGKIAIKKKAIAKVAAFSATECYGVVELLSRSGKHNNNNAKENHRHKGVKVTIEENKISLDIFLVLKYGMSITALSQSIRASIKYKVEQFSGMEVTSISLHILGVRV